jgi:hypothetical protein
MFDQFGNDGWESKKKEGRERERIRDREKEGEIGRGWDSERKGREKERRKWEI